MLNCFLSYFFVLVRVGTSSARSSPLLGFLKLVVTRIEGDSARSSIDGDATRHAECSIISPLSAASSRVLGLGNKIDENEIEDISFEQN